MRKNWLIVVLATVLTLIAAFALVGLASAAGSSGAASRIQRGGRSSGNDGARCCGYTFGSHEGGPAYANAHPQAGREA